MLRLLKITAPLLALLLVFQACSDDGDVTDPDDPDTWHELPWHNDHSSDVTRPGLPTLRINTPKRPKQKIEDYYDELIEQLKDWIETRMLWLNENIAAL